MKFFSTYTRCLEVMQDDMMSQRREFEAALAKERKKIITQAEMTQKILRLENIMPKHMIIKSFDDSAYSMGEDKGDGEAQGEGDEQTMTNRFGSGDSPLTNIVADTSFSTPVDAGLGQGVGQQP